MFVFANLTLFDLGGMNENRLVIYPFDKVTYKVLFV